MTTRWRPRQTLRRFFRQVLERRVVPWLLAYLAGAWVVLEATSYMVRHFGWSPAVERILPVVLGFGALSTIVLAWYHGAAGWQQWKARELILHGAIAVGLGAALWTGSWTEPAPRADRDAPSLRRIAVLYFKDHTGGELSRLAQDLTEGVVHELAQLEPLDVLPLAAVAPYRVDSGLSEVVRNLGVGTVVEGSVSQQGDSLRVIAQLVNAVPETHFGSWEWTLSVARANEAFRALSAMVADSIRVSLGRQIRTRELESAAASEVALRHYRQGTEIYEREAATDWADDREGGLALLAQADSLLAEAERLDPGWSAPAIQRSMIAQDRSLLSGRLGVRNLEDLREGINHATRALQAGSDSAAALERRGKLRFAMAEHSPAGTADTLIAAAEEDLRAANRLGGPRPEALMGLSDLKERQGNFRAALDYAERAVEADAFLEFDSGVLSSRVSAMLQLNDLEGARRLNDLARQRFPRHQQHLLDRLVILGSLPQPADEDIQRAWATADTLADLGLEERTEGWLAYGHVCVAGVLSQVGLVDSADAVIRRARLRLADRDAQLQHAASYQEAHARLLMGQRDSALALLRHYAEGYPSRAPSLLSDWWFRELWDDPEFVEITGTTPLSDDA